MYVLCAGQIVLPPFPRRGLGAEKFDRRITNIDLSQHFLVRFNSLLVFETTKERGKISYRSKDVNITEFCSDVKKNLQSARLIFLL